MNFPSILTDWEETGCQIIFDKLPMLSAVLSYPTTIFIDKSGKVRKIHTGFNGPATGDKYDAFVQSFEAYVGKLLAEDIHTFNQQSAGNKDVSN